MKRFTVRAHLRAPLIRRGYITLDALLMSVLQRGDVSDLLLCEDGLYFASAGMIDGGLSQRAAFVASMRPEHSPHWLATIRPNTHTAGLPQTDQGRMNDLKIGLARQREAGNILSAYTATQTPHIEWYGTGEADAVLAAVRDVPFIGKRRTAGYGEVVRWEVEAGDLDGIVGHFGEPLRPVPVDRWRHGGDFVPMEAAWKAPYWEVRNRTCCYLPAGL